MPRNYKTGPARSRRRPDPGITPGAGTRINPTLVLSNTPGAGSLNIVVQISAEDSAALPQSNTFNATGRTTICKFQDVNGANHTPTVTVDPLNSTVTYDWASGLPAGAGFMVLPAFEPSVRGNVGQYIGPLVAPATIT